MIQTKGPRGDPRRPPSPPTGVDLESVVPLEVMPSSRRRYHGRDRRGGTTQHGIGASPPPRVLVVRSPNIKASLSGAAADEGEWVGSGSRRTLAVGGRAWLGSRSRRRRFGTRRRSRKSARDCCHLPEEASAIPTTTNLRTRNEEEATAGGIRRFGGVGLSPAIVGGDDLTRRAAHARMDLVDGAFVLRGGGGPSTRARTQRTA
jgi:hypothetical protein